MSLGPQVPLRGYTGRNFSSLAPVLVIVATIVRDESEPSPMRDETRARREAILRDALETMLRDHGTDIDLGVVAHRIGTSTRQLQRIFAELGDGGFRETLAAIRMAHARRLLTETERPIGAIARFVGYCEAAQFTKAFRHHHGMTPREFRRASAESAPNGPQGAIPS
jgi:transcriptional regulator GlxA family with amidase domain